MVEHLPLTGAQEGVWYAQALDERNPVFNTGLYLEIPAALDVPAFRRAVRLCVEEAEALHARFVDGPDGPRQVLVPPAGWTLPVHDLTSEPDPDAVALARMRADLARPRDLRAGDTFRFALFVTGRRRFLWYQSVHHIAADGYALSLITARVADLYQRLVGDPAPAAGQGRRFDPLRPVVDADVCYRASPAYRADRQYWLSRFADRPDVASLAGRTAATDHRFHRSTSRLPAGSTDRLGRLARRLGGTWPELLVALTAGYLARCTATEDVVLGLPVMGRLGTAAARVPAMAVNVPPLRLRVPDGMPLADLLRQVRQRIGELRRHDRYRYEQLARDLGARPGGRRLAGPQLNVLPFDFGHRLAGVHPVAHHLSAGPVDDLTICVYALRDGGLRLDVDANPKLYTSTETAAHAARLRHLYRTTPAGTPGALEVLPPSERRRLLVDWQGEQRPDPAPTLPEMFAAQVRRTPDAPALRYADGTLTYRQLSERVERLAAVLAGRGVRPGQVVAVALPRSVALVVALYAVHRAGAAYLPLDPGHPRQRLARLLADSAPSCVVTDTATLPGLPDVNAPVLTDEPASGGVSPAPRRRAPSSSAPAYLIYTSGSTGEPKGVMVPHSGIANRLRWMQERYHLRADDRVLQKTPASFDVSVWEFFWPLCVGATLVLARPDGHRDPGYLSDVIRREHITTVHFVPSMLDVFLTDPNAGRCTSLRRVICSGETLPAGLAARFHATMGAELHNLYGPTEASVDVTAWHCRPGATDDPVPIGRPIHNTRCHVLDAAGRPVPTGVPGELHLAGAGLATGYHNRPGLTARRFVPDPFGTGRMYRTGDLARWRHDGVLEFLGRTDHQVKVRGVRIEPGEVEAAMVALPDVARAVVLDGPEAGGGRRLLGYLVPAPGASPDPAEVRRALAARLPAAYLPDVLVVVDALPLTSNGKLDRAALPAPGPAGATGRAPRDATEQRWCALVGDVLGVADVGPDDNFFDLGGHSLSAARLVTRAREELSVAVPVGAVFTAPNVAALADAAPGHGLDPLVTLRVGGDRPPLFCVHPAGGISWCYAALLPHLAGDRPVYGVQARGLTGDEPLPGSIGEMADDYLTRLRRAHPHGPYHLLGWSVGGVIAQEMAVRLQRSARRVGMLALLDAYPAVAWRKLPAPDETSSLTALLHLAGRDPDALAGRPVTRESVLALLRDSGSALAGLPPRTLDAVARIVGNNARRMREHEHRRFPGHALFFTAGAPREEDWLSATDWLPHVGGLDEHEVPTSHAGLVRPGAIEQIGATVAARMRTLDD